MQLTLQIKVYVDNNIIYYLYKNMDGTINGNETFCDNLLTNVL